MNLNGTEYYYIRNAQGDITGLIDASKNLVVTYSYDSWGNPISGGSLGNTVGAKNPYRYRGYRYDSGSGLFYVGSRYYDPQIGRFINADATLNPSLGLTGMNLFAYCGNNPVNREDPSGHFWREIGDWFVGAGKAIGNFFSPKTNTISGKFQEGIFRGSGSLTSGYSEFNGRLQVNSKDSKNNGMLGGYGKVSVGNANAKIGIGNDKISLSAKGVGDALTATAQAGIQYKDGLGLAAKAKASVLSGRATAEFELFGWQIEYGVSGDVLSVGAEAMIGVFPNEGFTAKASVGAGLFGGGFVFRVKPPQ